MIDKKQGTKISLRQGLWLVLFFFYLLVLIKITVFPTDANKPQAFIFIPFKSIHQYISVGMEYEFSTSNIKNLIGNILMFIPLGFIVPLLDVRLSGLVKVILIGLGVSLFIEGGQFLFASNRITDIDDVILNLTGVITGYGFYKLVFKKDKAQC
ncbi:MAG: VanZ family protein [Bacteroidota bacterium]